MHTLGGRAAYAITWLRVLLLPVTWWFALLGQGRIVGLGLLLAGVTDFLDGFVAPARPGIRRRRAARPDRRQFASVFSSSLDRAAAP